MNIVFVALKWFVNVILFCFYSLVAIFLENFIFWLILTKFLDKTVPGSENSIHLQLAVFTIILTFIITFFLRKYLYISININILKNTDTSDKKKSDNSEEEKMEIFIDKEIK